MALPPSLLEMLLKRDRALVAAALGLVVALAWADLVWMASDMGDDGAAIAWSPGYFAAMFAMWAIMMAGMMLPSAAPAILLFNSLCRHSSRPAVGAPLLFALGYLIAWSLFSLAATAAQWWLSETQILSAAMASDSARFAGALFVVAGLYQFSALKRACLGKCRTPAEFLAQHRRDGAVGALVMGIDHGMYCVGCCWALMALLFAFGVMNLMWVAAIAAFVLAEKILPSGPRVALAAGVAMMAIGAVLINA